MPVQGKKKLFGAAAIIVLTCLLAAPAMACWTPLEWQAKPVQWSRDQDQNGLDDTLDQLIVEDAEARAKAVAKEPAPVPITAPIVVNLTRCPQQADIDWLADYGTIVKMGRFVTFVAMDDVAVSDLPTIDGAVVWRSPPLYVSYASPIAIDVEGQEQIVFLSAEEVFGLDAGNGAVLWRSPCRNGFANNASDPVWNGDGLLWVASQPGDGARVLRLARHGDGTTVERLWADHEIALHFWNAIRVDGHVYASLGPAGTDFTAVDLRTGEVAWREERFRKARPIRADGKLILLDEDGWLVLARVSPEKLEVLAETRLFEREVWTVPTLAGTTLYARNQREVVALDLAASAP